jgi:pimeloyl-ACP methyl ester carboxylesterase
MTVPTLLLHGTGSPWPTRRICDLLERILPDAQLKTIGGAGHMAPMTHRDQVNTMVIAQLDSNSQKTHGRATSAQPVSRTNGARTPRTPF